MANTYVDYTATASQTDFAFSFPYLEDSHVVVEIDGVDKTLTTDYTIVTSPSKKVVLTSGATAGQLVRVKRVSGYATDLVDFVNGSVLNEADLDKAYLHNRYLNEEAAEGNNASMQTVGGGTDFNAESKKIVNLATPTVGTDAANKNYIDDRVALGSTNLNAFDKSTHTGDNTETQFTLSFTSQSDTAEAYIVTIDGVVQIPTTAYSVSTSTNKITFTSAPPTSANIVVVPIGTTTDLTTSLNLAGIDPITATGSTKSRSLADRFADVVNVKDFDAAGNGVADDTSEIQAAINSGAKRIYIPAGTYNHTGLSLVEDQLIYGDGAGTILHNTGSGVSVQAVGTSSNFFNGCVIRDLKLTGTASASHGIRLVDATRNNIIQNVYVADHGGDGIRLEANVGTTVDNCDLKENVGAGINITESSDYAYSSTNCVSNCHITGNDGGGVKVIATTGASGVYANVIKSNVIENNNVASTSGSGVIIDGAWKTDVADNAFESSFDSCILITNASGYVSASTTISSNSFANSGSPTQVYDVDIVRGDDTLIVGNTFPASGPTASIRETAGSNLIYQANKNLTRTGTGITNVQKLGFDEVLLEKIESRGALANTITGFRESISEKTGDYSIVQTDSGKRFTNNGAGGVVTLSLPASAIGLSFSFTRVNASHALRIDPDGTESIRNGGVATGGAGKYLSLDSNGGSVTVCCTSSTGVWDVVAANNGTLSIES